MRKNIKKFLEPAFCDKGALSLIIINNTLKSLTNVAMAVAIKSLIDLSTL
ncbi:hypothetical protein KA478_04345 [Patescibacteria group bacterium]|nr:hypothetical protein [Patescibacteria group bacterium]